MTKYQVAILLACMFFCIVLKQPSQNDNVIHDFRMIFAFLDEKENEQKIKFEKINFMMNYFNRIQ